MLETSYELLRLAPPFSKWKLPHADEIEFRVTMEEEEYGEFCIYTRANTTKEKLVIGISCIHVRCYETLLAVMAHEMCHLREHRLKVRTTTLHGKVFQRLADQVCRHHGFKRNTF